MAFGSGFCAQTNCCCCVVSPVNERTNDERSERTNEANERTDVNEVNEQTNERNGMERTIERSRSEETAKRDSINKQTRKRIPYLLYERTNEHS